MKYYMTDLIYIGKFDEILNIRKFDLLHDWFSFDFFIFYLTDFLWLIDL